MPSKVNVKLDLLGEKELKKILAELPKRCFNKGMRRALTLAAQPILSEAKRRAPRDTGVLKKSLKKKVKTYAGKTVVAIIGPDRSVTSKAGVELGQGKNRRVRKKPFRRPANYAHLLEFGHAGPHPAKARPFLGPAYRHNEKTVIETAKKVLVETLLSEAAKAKAKPKK